jgi:outer membrane scaffolding protein for murein synthesis (MipA/OmpV family)
MWSLGTRNNLRILATLAVVATSAAAAAQPRATYLGIDGPVLAPGARPAALGAAEQHGAAVPYGPLDWNRRYTKLFGSELKSDAPEQATWRLGPAADYRHETLGNLRSRKLAESDDDTALQMGPLLGFETPEWDGSLQVTKDVASGQEGYLTTLGGGYSLSLSRRARLRLGAETSYASREYMSRYFGVDPSSAQRSGISSYDAEQGFLDFGLNASLLFNPSDSWTISGMLSYQRLVGNAEDSPLLDDEEDVNQFFGGVIGIYNF